MKAASIFLALAFISQVLATDYYVRKDGSDSNDGLSDNSGGAKLTIQAAVNLATTAGDTVYVRAGTYAERVTSAASGSAGNVITLSGDRDSTIIGAYAGSHAYITMDGFTIDGTEVTGAQGAIDLTTGADNNIHRNILISGSPYYGYNIRTATNDCTFEDSRVENTNNHGIVPYGDGHTIQRIYMHSPNGADALRCIADNTTFSQIFVDNWTNELKTSGTLNVSTTYVFSTVGGGADFSNVGAGAGPYSVNQQFTATGTTPTDWGTATVQNTNHTDLFQSFSVGGSVTSDNVVIERCLFLNCDGAQIGNMEDQSQATDGAFTKNVKNWTIRNNLFVDVSSQMNGYIEDFKWYNNTFIRSSTLITGGVLFFNYSGDALNITSVDTGADTATMSGNFTITTGEDITAYDHTGTLPTGLTDATVYYVRVISGSTVAFYTSSGDASSDTNRIDLTGAGSGTVWFVESGMKGNSHNADIRNNIFFECGNDTTSQIKGWYGVTAGNTGATADYNLTVGTGGGTTKTGYTDNGYETNGINGSDPLFVDASVLAGDQQLTGWDGINQTLVQAIAANYKVQSGSPVIDAGVSIGSFTDDFEGTTRGANWYIGAFDDTGAVATSTLKRVTGAAKGLLQ